MCLRMVCCGLSPVKLHGRGVLNSADLYGYVIRLYCHRKFPALKTLPSLNLLHVMTGHNMGYFQMHSYQLTGALAWLVLASMMTIVIGFLTISTLTIKQHSQRLITRFSECCFRTSCKSALRQVQSRSALRAAQVAAIPVFSARLLGLKTPR